MKPSKFALVCCLAVLGSMLFVTGAQAGHLQCGQVIITDTTLDRDVGPCLTDGIVIGASNITLDLNGHHIFGGPRPEARSAFEVVLRTNGVAPDVTVIGRQVVAYTSTVGVGVRVPNQTGVTIKGPGRISNFDAGVALEGGGSHTVTGIEADHNIGSGLIIDEYGDGIALNGSDNNLITNNNVHHNGPYDGIGMFSGTVGNTISGNKVNDNFYPNLAKAPVGHHSLGTDEDDGIRLEPGSSKNVVVHNEVKRNGLDGIAVFPASADNVVQNNVMEENGLHNQLHRKGDGFRTFLTGDRTLVENNGLYRNGANGIFIDSKNNQILTNTALGNNVLPNPAVPSFDLQDRDPACDNNVWSGNVYGTAFPDCTKA